MEKVKLKKIGGSQQFVLECAEDIALLKELHESHWMCTSVPTKQLNFPKEFTNLLDRNQSGRIFAEDILFYAEHILNHYEDLQAFDHKDSKLNFTHLKGKQEKLLECAQEVCTNLQIKDPKLIDLKNLQNDKLLLSEGTRNGDGIIPSDDIAQSELRASAQLVTENSSKALDASGKKGLDQKGLDSFHEQTINYLNWIDEGQENQMSFQDHIDEIWDLYTKLHDLIDHFFQASKA